MTAKTVAMMIMILYNLRICQSKRYDNYTLFFLTPWRYDQVKFLKALDTQKYMDVIFWKKPNLLRQEVHCVVSPEDKAQFLQRAHHFDLKTSEKLDDVQSAFDNQHIKRYFPSKIESYTWKYYHTLEDIYQWLVDISKQYRNKTKLITIGTSAEGRKIYALSIKHSRDCVCACKNKVIVEGGIHGHEWIAVEFVTYLVNVLLKNQKPVHPRLHELAEQYNWFLIPVVNPDGYIYSQREDRLWRKNRRLTSKNATGVDLNRNFDYSWGKFDSSKNPEDDYFCGDRPFSEPETRALKNFILQQKNNLSFYFSVHAYGQQLIIPYSDRINHIGNFGEMQNFGKQAIMSMYKMNGRKYGTGSNYDTLGNKISGNSASWVKKTFGLRYVFTLLLRDQGDYGYALPTSQILEACEETTNGLTELMTAKLKRVKLDLFSEDNRAQELKGAIFILFCVVFIILVFK